MVRGNRIALALLCMSTSFTVSCGGTDPGARVTQPSDKRDDGRASISIWSDYLVPDIISSFAYLLLDKKELPNLVNLDPAIMARVALNDPGNTDGVERFTSPNPFPLCLFVFGFCGLRFIRLGEIRRTRAIGPTAFGHDLRHGCRNGFAGALDKNPEGELESLL